MWVDARSAGRVSQAPTCGSAPRVVGGPVVAGDTVVVATEDRIVALDLETGEDIWTTHVSEVVSHTSTAFTGGLLVSDGTLAVPTVAWDPRRSIAALDLATGERLWDREFETYFTDRLAADPTAFYVAERDLRALDPRTGHELWIHELDRPPVAPPAIIDDAVVVLHEPGDFQVVDARTGDLRETLRTDRLLHGAFVAADGAFYGCTAEGSLVAVR